MLLFHPCLCLCASPSLCPVDQRARCVCLCIPCAAPIRPSCLRGEPYARICLHPSLQPPTFTHRLCPPCVSLCPSIHPSISPTTNQPTHRHRASDGREGLPRAAEGQGPGGRVAGPGVHQGQPPGMYSSLHDWGSEAAGSRACMRLVSKHPSSVHGDGLACMHELTPQP